MLTPEYLQNVPDNMIKLYAQAEADILADMARRISAYDYWIPAVEHQTKMLEEAGMVREDILARLKKLTGKTKKELRELMQDAGNVALKSDDEVYKRNGLDPPPIGASKDLQQILQAGYDKTAGTFQNLTMTTVRTATRQFEQALDRAYMQITMGGMDYNTSIRRAIKQLSADGVGAIKYPSGRVDSIEVAVRRALVTGVNQTALRLQDARADEVGSDLVEVSAHSGARPEHAKWQGGIYSRSGKSKKYPGLVEVTGYGTALGLGGINCSHSFRPWFEGMSRTYSEGLLEEYEARNFEYNGKKLTEYEALQEQRKIERNIRRWKREQNAMAAAGQDVSEAAAKVREWNATHRDFLEQTGLKPDGTRLAVGKGGTMSGSKYELPKKEKHDTLKLKDYSLFKYGGEAERAALQKQHGKNITKEENKLIYKHTKADGTSGGYVKTFHYSVLNSNLRQDGFHTSPLDEDDLKTIEALRSAIQKNTLDDDYVLTRYVNADYLSRVFGIMDTRGKILGNSDITWARKKNKLIEKVEEDLKSLSGKTINEKAFVSTSFIKDKNIMQDKAVRFEILAPKGTNAFVTKNRAESEVVLGGEKGLNLYIDKAEYSELAHQIIIRAYVMGGGAV